MAEAGLWNCGPVRLRTRVREQLYSGLRGSVMDPRPRSWKSSSRVIERLEVAALVVVLASFILWTRQNSRALLRVDSLWAALGEVAFWALPSLVVFILLLRTRAALVIGGLSAAALLCGAWWHAARDGHSTASWLPGITGWFLLPVILVFVGVATTWTARKGHARHALGRTRKSLL